jgi:hypothetical protein
MNRIAKVPKATTVPFTRRGPLLRYVMPGRLALEPSVRRHRTPSCRDVQIGFGKAALQLPNREGNLTALTPKVI